MQRTLSSFVLVAVTEVLGTKPWAFALSYSDISFSIFKILRTQVLTK